MLLIIEHAIRYEYKRINITNIIKLIALSADEFCIPGMYSTSYVHKFDYMLQDNNDKTFN